jgi:acetoin utilization deacetylase AcuC-like enzyme
MARVSLLLHLDSIRHRNGYGHPEGPDRVTALGDAVSRFARAELLRPSLELHRTVDPTSIHSAEYVESLRSRIAEARDLVMLDEDTCASVESFAVAMEGLSLQEQGIDIVFSERRPVFVCTRPPGHHARPSSSMGFCLFGNAAYAARYAQKTYGVKRVAIVDWDIHHGNGTEEIFLDDSSVLTISLHAYPYWPLGYGSASARGLGGGRGYNLNLPLPFEAGDWQYIQYFENFVLPALERFEPELLIVAAGFDAHRLERNSRTNEQSLMALSENGYSYMTHRLHRFALGRCEGRFYLELEGGYYLRSLCSSVEAVLSTLIEERAISYPGFTAGEGMDEERFRSYVAEIAESVRG